MGAQKLFNNFILWFILGAVLLNFCMLAVGLLICYLPKWLNRNKIEVGIQTEGVDEKELAQITQAGNDAVINVS